MTYLIVKHLHISFVLLSICFFSVRYFWSLHDSPMLQQKWVKIVPHIVDSLLLIFGLWLLLISQLWPTHNPWLATKLIALLVYIILGTFAIKRGKTKRVKTITGILAIMTYIYMFNVAISHNPLIVF